MAKGTCLVSFVFTRPVWCGIGAEGYAGDTLLQA